MEYLECLGNSYPNHAKVIDIGKSVEGRQLKVLKIGLAKKNIKPAIWIDGGIHAREWTSPEIVQYIIYQLVEQSSLKENKNVIENYDVYVLPIMNPDG